MHQVLAVCYSTSAECMCAIVLALNVWSDVCMNQWGEFIVFKLSIIIGSIQKQLYPLGFKSACLFSQLFSSMK